MMAKLVDILLWILIVGFLLAAIHEAANLG
jgi:hypothetical protein